MEGFLKKHPAPDKETDQFAWAAHMNGLQAMAEENVLQEIIYNIWNEAFSFIPVGNDSDRYTLSNEVCSPRQGHVFRDVRMGMIKCTFDDDCESQIFFCMQ